MIEIPKRLSGKAIFSCDLLEKNDKIKLGIGIVASLNPFDLNDHPDFTIEDIVKARDPTGKEFIKAKGEWDDAKRKLDRFELNKVSVPPIFYKLTPCEIGSGTRVMEYGSAFWYLATQAWQYMEHHTLALEGKEKLWEPRHPIVPCDGFLNELKGACLVDLNGNSEDDLRSICAKYDQRNEEEQKGSVLLPYALGLLSIARSASQDREGVIGEYLKLIAAEHRKDYDQYRDAKRSLYRAARGERISTKERQPQGRSQPVQ